MLSPPCLTDLIQSCHSSTSDLTRSQNGLVGLHIVWTCRRIVRFTRCSMCPNWNHFCLTIHLSFLNFLKLQNWTFKIFYRRRSWSADSSRKGARRCHKRSSNGPSCLLKWLRGKIGMFWRRDSRRRLLQVQQLLEPGEMSWLPRSQDKASPLYYVFASRIRIPFLYRWPMSPAFATELRLKPDGGDRRRHVLELRIERLLEGIRVHRPARTLPNLIYSLVISRCLIRSSHGCIRGVWFKILEDQADIVPTAMKASWFYDNFYFLGKALPLWWLYQLFWFQN